MLAQRDLSSNLSAMPSQILRAVYESPNRNEQNYDDFKNTQRENKEMIGYIRNGLYKNFYISSDTFSLISLDEEAAMETRHNSKPSNDFIQI